MWTIFWRMVVAVVQHAAERELFVAGEIAGGNGPNKLGVQPETGRSALGHVWTAPPWQELSDVAAALVGCGHVCGLFVRPVWPLAIMLCADRVPIVNTHSKMR